MCFYVTVCAGLCFKMVHKYTFMYVQVHIKAILYLCQYSFSLFVHGLHSGSSKMISCGFLGKGLLWPGTSQKKICSRIMCILHHSC